MSRAKTKTQAEPARTDPTDRLEKRLAPAQVKELEERVLKLEKLSAVYAHAFEWLAHGGAAWAAALAARTLVTDGKWNAAVSGVELQEERVSASLDNHTWTDVPEEGVA